MVGGSPELSTLLPASHAGITIVVQACDSTQVSRLRLYAGGWVTCHSTQVSSLRLYAGVSSLPLYAGVSRLPLYAGE